MTSKSYTNNDFAIILKTESDPEWRVSIDNIPTPTTITFAISTTDNMLTIKKITWDFGAGNQHKSFTNRKQNLLEHNVDYKYKKSHDTTITVNASVYTDEAMFVTSPVITTTTNHAIKEHYVEPEVFKKQILDYYDTKVFTNDVAESIYKIASRLAFSSNFINYTYREEMVGDAVLRMVEALTAKKFDPAKGNPFSYFTKIAFHAFCNRIKREKRSREALTNYQEEVYGKTLGDRNAEQSEMDNDSHDDL